mgnify:CR=1 FL=1
MSTPAKNLGYNDTPIIPGTCWHVHDGNRPQPKVVKPPGYTTHERAGSPPSDAVVLLGDPVRFSADWVHVKDGAAAKWTLGDSWVEVQPKTGDVRSVREFGDIHLHVEFAAPSVVKGEGQGRGNSGIFLMGLYEVQVLDCYENPTYPDGTTGAMYGQFPPLANACRPPGQWQTYDIFFVAPRFDAHKLLAPAYITVILNGILLHLHQPLQGPTLHRKTTEYKLHPPVGPIHLQDHGDLVRFRNIWVRPINRYDEA